MLFINLIQKMTKSIKITSLNSFSRTTFTFSERKANTLLKGILYRVKCCTQKWNIYRVKYLLKLINDNYSIHFNIRWIEVLGSATRLANEFTNNIHGIGVTPVQGRSFWFLRCHRSIFAISANLIESWCNSNIGNYIN